jgi:cell division protein FtsA
MQPNNPSLFVEINESSYIFMVVTQDENQNFKMIEKIITQNAGIEKNKFVNINEASEVINKNVEQIEKKINYIFKSVTITLDIFDYSCINISGFKKLNGSQVLKENISYILNLLKRSVAENEKQKTILHIFNCKSILDGVNIENLPIGLFGDFYSHELTFFLIKNNELKNMKQIFNKSNLIVKKIILKSFSEGVHLINKDNIETFFKIKINKKNSNISFFDQASFKYTENFNFGTNIIFRDVEKICSIKNNIIVDFLSENVFINKKINDNEYLEEKYFNKNSFRKIRKKLILDIVNARVEEICNIIMNKNINIQNFKKNKVTIYLTIQDKIIKDNFNVNFKSLLSKREFSDIKLIDDFELNSLAINTAKLSTFGWKKEAIPIIQPKKSIITRIFDGIFG